VIKCFPKPNKAFGRKAHRAEMLEQCSVYRVATLQHHKPKAIVAMGTTACEAFMGSAEIKEYEGARWIPNEPFVREYVPAVWVCYSPAYAIQDPSQSVPIYRTLFSAAEEAGLNPVFDPTVEPYDYGT
jgi:uracil-DNA glycosylase family 4